MFGLFDSKRSSPVSSTNEPSPASTTKPTMVIVNVHIHHHYPSQTETITPLEAVEIEDNDDDTDEPGPKEGESQSAVVPITHNAEQTKKPRSWSRWTTRKFVLVTFQILCSVFLAMLIRLAIRKRALEMAAGEDGLTGDTHGMESAIQNGDMRKSILVVAGLVAALELIKDSV